MGFEQRRCFRQRTLWVLSIHFRHTDHRQIASGQTEEQMKSERMKRTTTKTTNVMKRI